jgi:hypothetical protein
MRLYTGQLTDLTDLEKEFFRNCYGRTGHIQTVERFLPGERNG